MKNLIKTPSLIKVISIVFALCTMSCQKYVDVKRSSTQGLLESANDCQLLLDNVDVMNNSYPNDGELTCDDFYLSNDGYLSSSTSQVDRDYYTWSKSAIRLEADPQWQKPYYVIYRSNLILEAVTDLESRKVENQVKLNELRGAALFFRSFAFWELAQIYSKSYSSLTADEDLGLPLRLNSDINEVSKRSTVSQTYNQIIDDLKKSVDLLPAMSIVPTRPSKAAAYAMLARAYLSMSNYVSALSNANSALELHDELLTYDNLSITSNSPFSPAFNEEVIFHAVTINTQVISPFGQGRINSLLVDLYDNNDLRKSLFFKSVGDGTFRFTGNYSGVSFSGNLFVGLAVDEMFLIRAECYARTGKISEAMKDLNSLLKSRWKINSYVDQTASSTTEATLKVSTERRKELVMRGLRWSDLKRYNLNNEFNTTLTRTVQGALFTLPPNDLRYTQLIPTEVINNSGITQNPR